MLAADDDYIDAFVVNVKFHSLLNTLLQTNESLIVNSERLRMEDPAFSGHVGDEMPSHIVIELVEDGLLIVTGLIVEGLPGIVQVCKTVSKVAILLRFDVILVEELVTGELKTAIDGDGGGELLHLKV